MRTSCVAGVGRSRSSATSFAPALGTTIARIGFRDSGENQRLICCPHFSWFRAGDPVGNGRKLLGFRLRVLLRFEFEGQLVDLTGELERNIIAILQHYRLCEAPLRTNNCEQ